MDEVTLEIRLTDADKERADVLELLVRESGNEKKEIVRFLQTHDVITVAEISMQQAHELIAQCERVGITASIVPQPCVMSATDTVVPDIQPEPPYKHRWNWWAFIFTYLWYVVKGLWVKLILYAAIQYGINRIPFFMAQVCLGLAFWFYIGRCANYDLYLKEEQKEHLWPKIPFKKWKKVFFICCLLFLGIAVVLPGIQGVKMVKYGATMMLDAENSRANAVRISGSSSFTHIPKEWWSFIDPPKGMNASTQRQVGNVTHTIKYTANKRTKMMAIMGTVPAISGMPNESVGVLSVEVWPPSLWRTFKAVDDPKTVAAVVKQFQVPFPVGLKWLRKFFTQTASEPTFEMFGGNKWGHSVGTREIHIKAVQAKSLVEMYWTVEGNNVIVVSADVFPEYASIIRKPLVSFMRSFTKKNSADAESVPASVQSVAPMIEPQQKTVSPSRAPLPLKPKPDKLLTVDEIVAQGLQNIKDGKFAEARACLKKAVALALDEKDLEAVERLRVQL